MAKNIVLFSDGTGNSAAKLNKTNVWRLYQALDLAAPSVQAAGVLPQVALYDDGVGTSGFRPLALLGGVFGYGLKRNVLDLYKFLCRNYQPGDHIYAFGFSRGAFTVRLLIGMVVKIGLVPYRNERLLAMHANDAYREYRRGFKATLLAGALRNVRDAAIAAWRKVRGISRPSVLTKPRVSFVGVWDTVAAYGMPIAEMTRAIDRWIWPLSMPNYVLSDKVAAARHALALDDERDTFHPLLWDEIEEDAMVKAKVVSAGRLQQVWFAGMHSDMGGGYPDDSLSYVSLDWMMAEAGACGLRFKQTARLVVAEEKNALGPMHDSRGGLGSYYRYQPRRLSARFANPPTETFLMQDPNPKSQGHLQDVVVHQSVIDRIRSGTDGYAPIVLPSKFSVHNSGGNAVTLAPGTDLVWNLVWRRRITYFLGLAVTLLFLLMPLLPPSDCEGPQCLVSPAVSAAGGVLPDFVRPWVKSWADNPTSFLILVAAMVATLSRSRALQRAIGDTMSDVWQRTLAGGSQTSIPLAGLERFIHGLRTSIVYQRSLQLLKWRAAPGALACAFLIVGLIAATVLAHRVPLAFIDVHGTYCKSVPVTPVGPMPTAAQSTFRTREPCWATGLSVEKDAEYRIALTVTEPWADTAVLPTSPTGFDSSRFQLLAPVLAPIRRSTTARWFQPVLTLRDNKSRSHTFPVSVLATEPLHDDSTNGTYSGTFVAPVSGEVFLFVNDVVLPWWPDKDPPFFYNNNIGSAQIALQRLPHAPRPGGD